MASIVITDEGAKLLADLIAGVRTAKFTQMQLSDHDYSGSVLTSLTSLDDVKQSVSFSSVSVIDSATVKLSAVAENTTITTAFYVNTIGLIAVDSNATSVLYAVINTTSEPDLQPAYDGASVARLSYTFNVQVGSVSSVTVDIVEATSTDQISYDNEESGLSATNAKQALDELSYNDDKIRKMFAEEETSTTASRAYVVGEYITLNGNLYKVTQAISNSGIITPGTNVIATTIAEELELINRRSFKDITDIVKSGLVSRAIAANVEPEAIGCKWGDYFTGASGYKYVIADVNVFKSYDTSYAGISINHWTVIVYTGQTTTWNTQSNGTKGGYVGSVLHAYLTEIVLANVKSDLTTLLGSWASHLLSHHKLYSTTVTASVYGKIGQASGASTSWSWSDNQYISALTEMQVYGGTVFSSSGFDTGEAFKHLEVFKKHTTGELFGAVSIWLRDVDSSSAASIVYSCGYADVNGVWLSRVAVGLINIY